MTAAIHAKISQSEQFARLSNLAGLMFLISLANADNYGRIHADAVLWALRIGPGRLTPASAKRVMREIETQGLAVRYQVDGRDYFEFQAWWEHQSFRSDAKLKSLYPSPETGQLEPERTFREANEEGLTKRRFAPAPVQPALIHVDRTPQITAAAPTIADEDLHVLAEPAIKTPAKSIQNGQIPIAHQLGLSLLILREDNNNSLNLIQSLKERDLAEKHIALAQILREHGRNGPWQAFKAVYPETAHNNDAPARRIFDTHVQQGELLRILTSAYQFRRLMEHTKRERQYIPAPYTWLSKETWRHAIDLSVLRPANGIDFTYVPSAANPEVQERIDPITGERFSEETWRERLQGAA